MNDAPFSLPERPRVRRLRPPDDRNPGVARTQPMRGYDPQYTDIVDYIVEITDEIWGERSVERIYDTYDADCVIYSSYGVVRSAATVVANTYAGLEAFPEYNTRHVNVAWSGNEDRGFYTAHLGFARSINLGPTSWGPATGKRTARMFAADCISKENRIHSEWLVHDAAAVGQLGFDIHELARKIGATLAIDHFPASSAHPFDKAIGAAADWAEAYTRSLWTLGAFDRLNQFYAEDAVVHAAGGREAIGLDAIASLHRLISAAMPGAAAHVEHVCHSDGGDGPVLAIRWLMQGRSAPGGVLGDCPSGRDLFMMAIAHLRFRGGKVVEQWLVFDELAMLAQTYR